MAQKATVEPSIVAHPGNSDLQPPNDVERIHLTGILRTMQRAYNDLEEMGSPWAQFVQEFGEALDGILNPGAE